MGKICVPLLLIDENNILPIINSVGGTNPPILGDDRVSQ